MKKKILVVAGLLAMSGALTAQSVYPGQHAGKLKRETVAPMKVKSFDLKDVRLLPSRFRENMMRDSVWMASIEVDRLLHVSVPMLACLQVVKVVILTVK